MSHFVKIIGLLFVVMLALTPSAWSKGPANVTNGLHNLSTTGVGPGFFPGFPEPSLYVTDSEEVCVFCHTPHGGESNQQLWNKDISSLEGAGVFTHYSNVLLSDALKGLPTDRAVNPESLLCLSCHDGSLSINAVHNVSNANDASFYTTDGASGPDTFIASTSTPNSRIGATLNGSGVGLGGSGDLSDDHPISFSYSTVLADTIYTVGSRTGELRSVNEAVALGVRFFSGTDANIECSSCHDPHVNYLDNPEFTPFLITANTKSALCFACHNK